MLSFNDAVLLRGLYTSSLMYDSPLSIKIIHKKLSTIITTYDFNGFIKLRLNICNEGDNEFSSLSFCFH